MSFGAWDSREFQSVDARMRALALNVTLLDKIKIVEVIRRVLGKSFTSKC